MSLPFPEFLANFSQLTSLRLSNAGLHGNVSDKIFKVTSIQTLDLSNNEFLAGFLPAFPATSSLQTLVLAGTQISGQLPDSIGSLRWLTILDLYECSFLGLLPKSMANLTQLVYLDLSRNMFTGSVPSFRGFKKLTQLRLSHNKFSGPVPSTYFEGLTRVVSINMRNNSFNGTIPFLLLTLPCLQKLDLALNRFCGQLDEFPNSSSSLIEIIDLESNNVEGPIPDSIFNLPNLHILTLSFNKFSGTINLHNIQKLGNLTSLGLSHNNLTLNVRGNDSTLLSFPPMISTLRLASCNLRTFPQLRNHSNLAYLDLSDNQIQGKIPSWIWSILGNDIFLHLNLSSNYLVGFEQPSPKGFTSHMTVLDLRSNMFQGRIPVLPPFASYMDYSANRFTSVLPYDIGDYLGSTIFFSVSGNQLTGNIPESLCNGFDLEVLDLSYNNLNGIIPSCLINMSSTLMVLNLRKNNFHGFIPEIFPASCNLRTLDLSENVLNGWLPKTLAGCTMLEVLNLGNNQINDYFPCWLKSFSNLRVLVLRNNNFYGSIECPDMNNSWTNLQILDLASNHFSSSLPSRYFSGWNAMMVNENDSLSGLDHLQHKVFMLSDDLYYQDKVMVTSKGLQMELVKILTIFTSIDLSNNMFQGEIPEELGLLKLLYVLNMSGNAFTGLIPSSIGNLKQLESLDLSQNKLNGVIPNQLAGLTFISFLNLSFNQLEGMIPRGSQFATFSQASFEGNKVLCGFPLLKNCTSTEVPGFSPPTMDDSHLDSDTDIDWCLIGAEIGLLVGFAIMIGPLVFCKKWRQWYFKNIVDRVLYMILPQLDRAANHGRRANRTQRKRQLERWI
ncbi:Leucine-rich-repeat receptor-like protein [Quillaja saponaria]|uniref:Leucine-rich-repeat receptor-like protein n=1 Tax=Quillaja saponaria TaxID=32244 RepID=A0AAD7LPL9_QUISA|nr:Leucine-rich-repeat receptor-like protein [Quillaja saponaria]